MTPAGDRERDRDLRERSIHPRSRAPATVAAESAAVADIGPDDEVSRAAEHRVEEQRGRRRVQARRRAIRRRSRRRRAPRARARPRRSRPRSRPSGSNSRSYPRREGKSVRFMAGRARIQCRASRRGRRSAGPQGSVGRTAAPSSRERPRPGAPASHTLAGDRCGGDATVGSYPATDNTSGGREEGAPRGRTRSLDGDGRRARGAAGSHRPRARRHGLRRARGRQPDLRPVRVRVRPDRGRR